MENKSKILNIVGYVWIILAAMYLLSQYLVVLMNSGVPFVSKLLSFINLWNILYGLIVFMPGLICVLAADKIKKNKLEAVRDRSKNFGAGE